MNTKIKNTKLYNTLAVVGGALLCGMLWRIRGDGGFGSMWGMFTVAAGFSLFVFSIFGDRKKMQFGMLPVLIILTGVTAAGWGTLNSQLSGYLGSSAPFAGELSVRVIEINPLYGLFYMLCLGFGWMPLMALLFSTYFSARKYKALEILLAVAVFFVSLYLFKATVSHLVVDLVSPKSVELFKDGLLDNGIASSPWRSYLQHFNSESWAKAIPGGRNYFACIHAVSAALAAAVMSIFMRIKFADKKAAGMAAAINGIAALSITVSNIPMNIAYERALIYNEKLGAFFEGIGSLWSLWEFFTGFFIGLGIMVLFMSQKREKLEESALQPEPFPTFSGKGLRVYYVLATLFVPALSLIRPLAKKLFEEGSAEFYILIAVLCIVCIAGFALTVRNSMVKKGLNTPVPMSFKSFSKVTFIVYVDLAAVLYFFVGDTLPTLTGFGSYITKIMLFSLAAVLLCFCLMQPLENKKSLAAKQHLH